MKSDREFLDGIYQKAAQYLEQPSQQWKKYRVFSGLAACLLICVLGISWIYTGKKGNVDSENIGVKNAKNSEEEAMVPRVLSLDTQSISNNPTLIVAGQISAIFEEKEKMIAEFLVEDCFYGIWKEETLMIENTTLFQVDDQLLLVLNKIDDKFFLAGEEGSIYRYVSGTGEEALYQSLDGFLSTPKEIITGWVKPSEEEHGIQ